MLKPFRINETGKHYQTLAGAESGHRAYVKRANSPAWQGVKYLRTIHGKHYGMAHRYAGGIIVTITRIDGETI